VWSQVIVPNSGILLFGTLKLLRPQKGSWQLEVEVLSSERFVQLMARLAEQCGEVLSDPHKHVELAEYYHHAKERVLRKASDRAMSIEELRYFEGFDEKTVLSFDEAASEEEKAKEKARIVCVWCSKSAKQLPEGTKMKSCGGCRTVYYCSRACQTAHWPTHKSACKLLAAAKEAEQ